MGGVILKKYAVNILFKNGDEMQFETDTNVLLQQPVYIKRGTEMVFTEEGASYNEVLVSKVTVKNNVPVTLF